MGLATLVYTSIAVSPPSDDDLVELLQQARTNNMRQHLTGMLLYQQGCFLQVIEGEEEILLVLEQRLRSDVRHHSMQRLLFEPLHARLFSAWKMGFRHVDRLQRRLSETVLPTLPFTDQRFMREPALAKEVLLSFQILPEE